jgi:hypothetical protein
MIRPRSDSEPMTFTRSEFLRGAIAAWVWFLILHQVALLFPLVGYGWFALYATLPWSVGALVLGSPFAYVLGLRLRKQSRVAWHLVAFTVLGLIVGTTATLLALWLPAWGIPSHSEYGALDTPAVLVAASAGPAVALGWWHTARRALAADRGETVGRQRSDPDAEFEDSI